MSSGNGASEAEVAVLWQKVHTTDKTLGALEAAVIEGRVETAQKIDGLHTRLSDMQQQLARLAEMLLELRETTDTVLMFVGAAKKGRKK